MNLENISIVSNRKLELPSSQDVRQYDKEEDSIFSFVEKQDNQDQKSTITIEADDKLLKMLNKVFDFLGVEKVDITRSESSSEKADVASIQTLDINLKDKVSDLKKKADEVSLSFYNTFTDVNDNIQSGTDVFSQLEQYKTQDLFLSELKDYNPTQMEDFINEWGVDSFVDQILSKMTSSSVFGNDEDYSKFRDLIMNKLSPEITEQLWFSDANTMLMFSQNNSWLQ